MRRASAGYFGVGKIRLCEMKSGMEDIWVLQKRRIKGFYGWISLSVSALVGAVGAGGMVYSFGAFLPSICRDLGWSRGLASGAIGLSMILMCISAPLVGAFISKRGPRQAFVAGNTMGAAGLMVLSVQQEVWQLYAGYGLIGLGVGLGGMIAATTIANNWFRKKATLAMGIVMAASGAGGIFMVPGIMAGIGRYGWRPTYMILSVTYPYLRGAAPRDPLYGTNRRI